jgi:circadian clock protein KaiC
MRKTAASVARLAKARTGIVGFDEITGGGLPRGRTTLVSGGPGSGKTVFALQSLVCGARDHGEPGIFVAFEESAERIVQNAHGFGWDLPALQRKKLFFLDAQPSPDLIQSGNVDLQGLIAALDAKVVRMRAKRVVFDSADLLFSVFKNDTELRRESTRLNDWLLSRGLTAVITARTGSGSAITRPGDVLPYLLDCAVELRHDEVDAVSQRSLRVLKYRGSSYAENSAPLLIGRGGLEVASAITPAPAPATSERISSGVRDLDEMLDGGYFRAASVLVTGAPGTAKTTIAGAFAEAACARGERAAFVSFDSGQAEIMRNLASVGIRLQRFVRSGLLEMLQVRATAASAETHLFAIRSLVERHQPRCLVVDPISAIGVQGNESTAHDVASRLIDWAKGRGITVVATSLLGRARADLEGSPLQVSTIADVWLHLSYLVRAGERNRALTIVKARGTEHSNQVRELILAKRGISLTDVYTAEGDVLMGSLRLQREQQDRDATSQRAARRAQRELEEERTHEDLRARLAALTRELELREAERRLRQADEAREDTDRRSGRTARVERRGGGARRA